MHPSEPIKHATFLVDKDRQVVSWNAECEDLFAKAAPDIIGHPISELLTEEYARKCAEQWPEIATGSPLLPVRIIVNAGRVMAAEL